MMLKLESRAVGLPPTKIRHDGGQGNCVGLPSFGMVTTKITFISFVTIIIASS